MEFLARMQVNLPKDIADARRLELLRAEAVRGQELRAVGSLRRIWRVPGRLANVSLYDVADATVLHEIMSCLPLWPWMPLAVEPLARHPLEADRSPDSSQ